MSTKLYQIHPFHTMGKLSKLKVKERSAPRGIELQTKGGVRLIATAKLPTRFGIFTIWGFFDQHDSKEHTVLVHGDVDGKEECPVRIHSECHTGDVWGSLRCDCREQLEKSIKYIRRQRYGAVIYLRQEGRGIGLLNKLKAYHLQDQGLDTVEANRQLGLPTDAREYRVAAEIIRKLNIRSVALLTNNPEKINGLRRENINISERIPLIVESNTYNQRYLNTKREKLGHWLG